MKQGLESTQDERACSALWAIKLDDEVGGRAIQVRVVQGLEPQHFLKIFKGKMVIFMVSRLVLLNCNSDDHEYQRFDMFCFDIGGTRKWF